MKASTTLFVSTLALAGAAVFASPALARQSEHPPAPETQPFVSTLSRAEVAAEAARNAGGIVAMAGWAMVQSEKETDGRIERTRKEGNRVVHERISKTGGESEYSVIVGNRFMVSAEGRGVARPDRARRAEMRRTHPPPSGAGGAQRRTGNAAPSPVPV